MKLELKHLASYLPYGLKINVMGEHDEDENPYTFTVKGLDIDFVETIPFNAETMDVHDIKDCFLLLRPLSQLTEQIKWELQTYAFTDLWETGDTDGCCWEFNNGNIKLIESIKNIAKYNCHNDINYLPYPVVQEMFRHKFDVFGLIDQNLALPITQNNEQ